MWRALKLSALLFFCLLPGGQAQQAPKPQTTIRKQVNLVLVDVIVTDPKGTIVSGLRANDFEILDEDIPQEVVHLSQDEIPLAIALVLDASGSMHSSMKPIQNALVRALPTLKSEDRVALFDFADSSDLLVGLTNDIRSIVRRIPDSTAPEGATNINEAIYNATDYLRKKAPLGRRVIVLLSDTIHSYDGLFTSPKEVERSLLQSEIALFGIREGIVVRTDAIDPKSVDVDRLAVESGGFMINLHSPNGYQAAFESLIKILKTRYTLSFYPNTAGKPGSTRHLKVRLKNTELQTALPNVVLRYRTKYVVPREKTPKSR